MNDEMDPTSEQDDGVDAGAVQDSELDDLDDLEGDGFDRALAEARGLDAHDDLDPGLGERPYTAEEAGLRTKVGWGRSPIISALVMVVGVFLLAATWSDFAYFLRSFQSEPRELGRVDEIYVDGEFTERFDNEWVVLEGDPDVQHAARMPGREGWIGFMRLVEGDASMFVAIPRATKNADKKFPGRFQGRMRRLDEVAQFEDLQVYFNAEEINDIVNLEPGSVVAAVENGGGAVTTPDGGSVELGGDDQLRLIVQSTVGMAQLGRTTWDTREGADAAIAALGKRWAFVEKRSTVWVYAVEVGADAPVETFEDLTKQLNGGDTLASADPKVGGLVLPRRSTYLVRFGDLQLDTADLSFTYGDNTAGTGWVPDSSDSRGLVPVELAAGRLSVPVASIAAFRLERSLLVNPDGYLLMVDQSPRDVWPSAVMFGAVLGVVLLNGWALVAALRRRRRAAEA